MELILRFRAWLVRLMLSYNDIAERRQLPVPALHTIVETIPSPSHRGFVRLRFHTPPNHSTADPNSKYPLVIDYHGGGYSSGSPSMDARFIGALLDSSTKPVVVCVEYSLCPEHPFPSAVEDSAAAVTWLANEGAQKYNLDPSRIVLLGFSAGGGLALTTSMWMEQHKAGQQALKLEHPLRGIVSIYPNVDSRRPREPAKTMLLTFLYSVWDDTFTHRSPVNSPFVSPAAADDDLLSTGLPNRIALYPVGEDPYVGPTEVFRERLLALGKHVTGHVELDAGHAWDKMPIKNDEARWSKRQDWFFAIAKDVEQMLLV